MPDRSGDPRLTVIDQDELLSRIAAIPAGQIYSVRVCSKDVVERLVRTCVGAGNERRLVYLPIGLQGSVGEAIASVVALLGHAVLSTWPVWFGDHDFGWYRDDALGNEQLRHRIRELTARDGRISSSWIGPAARQAASGTVPRVATDPGLQLFQLSLALSRAGIILIIPFPSRYDLQVAAVAVELVEWLVRHAPAAVVPLIPVDWPDEAPLDRLLFNAWTLTARDGVPVTDWESVPGGNADSPTSGDSEFSYERDVPAVSAIRGFPHPLSEIEKRVWRYLAEDLELAALFSCNQTVLTIRGNSPRVDLLWADGRLVVELDGFADHSVRDAFERDRHRDYELLLSGYQVLRITNDEINRDLEAAIGKIRDVVRLRRHD